jgi:hypothetical protein
MHRPSAVTSTPFVIPRLWYPGCPPKKTCVVLDDGRICSSATRPISIWLGSPKASSAGVSDDSGAERTVRIHRKALYLC